MPCVVQTYVLSGKAQRTSARLWWQKSHLHHLHCLKLLRDLQKRGKHIDGVTVHLLESLTCLKPETQRSLRTQCCLRHIWAKICKGLVRLALESFEPSYISSKSAAQTLDAAAANASESHKDMHDIMRSKRHGLQRAACRDGREADLARTAESARS